MYVKRTVRRRGDKSYTYLSLVEAVRVDGKNTQRVLVRLGEVGDLERTGQLDRIIAALRAHADRYWVAADEVEGNGAPSFGAVAAVRSYFCRLGLDDHFAGVGKIRGSRHLEDTVLVMVAKRLCEPGSKRRTILEWSKTVAFGEDVRSPTLDQCYRGIDAVADAKEATETLLYDCLTDLTNLDLRLALYDLTSTYFETSRGPSDTFASRAYGCSRDRRSDRPQVVIGLLVTGNGIPIAHYVFPGNTRDSTTLPTVMADYQRFGLGKIALVADRGLITEANLDEVIRAGFDHVLATRLHRDDDVSCVLEAAHGAPQDRWVKVPPTTCVACEVHHDGRRFVVVSSPERKARDDARREQLLVRTEDNLVALGERVRAKRLTDPAKIGAAADRILHDSGVARCFTTTIGDASFHWDFDTDALRYEEDHLAGRYVLTTSLDHKQASTADVVRHYRMLQNVERRFRIMKDFLGLRPVFHRLEDRVRGHIALCVIAAVIEAVIGNDLDRANLTDPDLPDQTMTPRRALAELANIRRHQLTSAGHNIEVIDRPSALQRKILSAFAVDTSPWNKTTIT